MDAVRVAIVGMGIGRDNGRGFAADPRSRVIALCDVLEDRMKDFAKELSGEVRPERSGGAGPERSGGRRWCVG